MDRFSCCGLFSYCPHNVSSLSASVRGKFNGIRHYKFHGFSGAREFIERHINPKRGFAGNDEQPATDISEFTVRSCCRGLSIESVGTRSVDVWAVNGT